jgi:hypothetical protein
LKTFVGKVKTINPLNLGIAGLVVVALLVVGGVLIFAGGDDNGDSASNDPTLGFAEGDPRLLPGQQKKVKQAPVVRTGVLDTARREGRLAVAQARGTILGAGRVRVSVSAAPKQTVRVNWQLGCYKDRQATIAHAEYRVRTPNTREINKPFSGADSCVATASAQLTRSDKVGRIKVSIIAGG